MRIAVIGAGMVGLVASLRLREAGHDVTLLERDTVPGGLAAGFVPFAGGAALERFYHHIFQSDTAMVSLIEELGLGADLLWKHPVTACLYDGGLYPLDSAPSLLRFKPLRVLDRLRLGAGLALLKASGSVKPFENRLATAWLKKTIGEAAYQAVFEPLFRSKFGSYADRVSLGWFWARIHDRTPKLGYLQGGFARLYEGLAARLSERGVTVRFGTPVSAIRETADGLTVDLHADGTARSETFDRVLATVPLRTLARLTEGIPPAYVEKHSPVASLWAHCIVLALDRPLTDAYWINVCERGEHAMPFMVLVEHTNLMPPADYAGKHLIYIGTYGEERPAAFDENTVAELTPHLQYLNPDFRPEWVAAAWQFMAPAAQPVVTTHYRERIAPVATPVGGLFMANLEQVYPHDRGQNYAIELAERVSREIAGA